MTNGEKFEEVFGFGADGSRVIAVNAIWWDCDFQIRKPQTNADRIRSMTDEELEEFLEMIPYCGSPSTYTTDGFCVDNGLKAKKQWLYWLRKEGE